MLNPDGEFLMFGTLTVPAGTIVRDGLDIVWGDIPGTDITIIFILAVIGTNTHATSPVK